MSTQTIPNPSASRWKNVLHFPLTRIVLATLFVLVSVIVVQGIIALLGTVAPLDSPLIGLLLVLISSVAVGGAYTLYVHLVERRVATELSGPGAFKEFGAGALLGLGLFAAISLVLWLLGDYQVVGLNPWIVLIPALVANVPSALIQEIIFRGVIFRITEESLGSWLALAISAVLFGLLHVLMEQATLLSVIAITLEAGVLLGAAYMLTHRLWLAIGIHIGWDMAVDGIFGVGHSGLTGSSIQGLFQAKLSGPVLITGGAAGVEASIIAVVILLAVSLVLLRKVIQEGHVISPYWKRKTITDPGDDKIIPAS